MIKAEVAVKVKSIWNSKDNVVLEEGWKKVCLEDNSHVYANAFELLKWLCTEPQFLTFSYLYTENYESIKLSRKKRS